MDISNKFNQLEENKTNYKNIILDTKNSLKTLCEFFKIASNDNCNLKITKSMQSTYKMDIYDYLKNNKYPQQKDITNYINKQNKKTMGNEQVSRLLNKFIKNKILLEIDHLDSQLKLNSRVKKSYGFNPITSNLLKNINNSCKKLKNLPSLRLSGFSELIRWLIDNELIEFENKKLVDIKIIPGKLQVIVKFVVTCTNFNCDQDLCKFDFYLILKDIIYILSSDKKFNSDLINIDKRELPDFNECVIDIKILKRRRNS